MFGLFSKNSENTDKYDPDEVATEYSGDVICGDFVAYEINRTGVDADPDTVLALYPHGRGKITFKHKGEVIEEYEGDIDSGRYHGKGKLTFPKGKLTDEPEVYEGTFEMGKFIEL